MKNIYILVTVFLFVALNAFATEQATDKLTFNGSEYWADGFSLKQNMFSAYKSYRKEAYNRGEKFLFNTGNYDGWSAELEITNQKLYITKLTAGTFRDRKKHPALIPSNQEAFGTEIPPKGLFAEWFSGKISAVFGKVDENGLPNHTINFTFKNGLHTKTEIHNVKLVNGKWISKLVIEQINN